MTSFVKKYWFYLLIGGILLIAFFITLLVYDEDGTNPDNTGSTPPGSSSVSSPGPSGPGGSSGDITSDPGSEDSGSDTATTPPDVTVDPAGPVLPAAGIKTETRPLSLKYQDKTVVTASIEYPRIEMATANATADRINAIFGTMADIYTGYANENMFSYAKDAVNAGDPSSSLPYRMNVQYGVKMNTRSLLSVVFTSTVFTGGSHEYLESKSVNISADGKKQALSTIFKVSPETYQKRIWDAVIAQVGDKTENYFNDYKNLIKTFSLEDRLYFTAEGLHVFYNPYEISTFAEGIVDFTLPYDTVADILSVNPLY